MKLKPFLLTAAVCLLTACGSDPSDHHTSTPPAPPAPPPAPVPVVDAFYTAVLGFFTGAEDAEPQAVEQLSPTMPDDTEPVAFGS